MIETHAKLAISDVTLLGDISHSFPESAYRLASLRHFSLIFLDLNCDFVENSLKVSLSIRCVGYTSFSEFLIRYLYQKVSLQSWIDGTVVKIRS